MARFNRGMALRPVHRIKHVFDKQGSLSAGAQVDEVPILTVDAPVLANPTEVETGSKVNGIYMKVECYATTASALANVYMAVWKSPGGNIASISPNAVGVDDDKRYVIHQEMVMLQQVALGNPRTLFNGVIVIPRGYKRFGPNDRLVVGLKSPGVTINYCMQAHYKEFR